MNITNNIALEYHTQSRNSAAFKHQRNQHFVHYRDDIKKITLERVVKPEGRQYPLPQAMPLFDVSFNQAMVNRRSDRTFSKPLSKLELATILYYAVGFKQVQSKFDRPRFNRFAPSSGGMNSVELFPIILNVDGIPPGIYHYDPRQHQLTEIKAGQFGDWLDEEVFYQKEWTRAGVCLAMASTLGKLSQKYGARAYRLALLDTGLVAQNIYLTASATNLKACASAGFIDDPLNEALQIDGYQTASFLAVMVGK